MKINKGLWPALNSRFCFSLFVPFAKAKMNVAGSSLFSSHNKGNVVLPSTLLVLAWVVLALNTACAANFVHEDSATEAPALSVVTPAWYQGYAPIKDGAVTAYVPERCYNGDPFSVHIEGEGVTSVAFTWRNKALTVIPGRNGQPENACEAIFAVPLDSKEQKMILDIKATTVTDVVHIAAPVLVEQKVYPVQRLTVQQKYVTPSAAAQERIAKDRKQINAALSKVTKEKYWTYPFQSPSPGEVTSLYGLRRFFNGQERNPHKGVDFDAQQGDPIQACDAGIVVLTGDFYYNGNTVIVDHGLGVMTSYLHMSQIDVAIGQKVERGQILGLIGSTGRVTGPHLHLGLSVLGQSVNAQPLIEGMN